MMSDTNLIYDTHSRLNKYATKVAVLFYIPCTLVNYYKVLCYYFLQVKKWNKDIYGVTGSTHTHKWDATITKIFSKHFTRYIDKALGLLLFIKQMMTEAVTARVHQQFQILYE